MPRIIPRAEWRARAPKYPRTHIPTPTPELWIHHTASEQHGAEGVRQVQNYHMDFKGWSDIAYSFLVDDDGSIYEGRGFGIAGGHTKNHNKISHAICFLGNFAKRKPTAASLASARWLFHEGVRLRQWSRLSGGHRDASSASTTCPGDYLAAVLHTIDDPIVTPKPTPKPAPKPVTEKDPVLYFDKSTKAYFLVVAGKAISLSTAEGYVLDSDNANVTAIRVSHDIAARIKAALA